MVLSYVSTSHVSMPYGGYGSVAPPYSSPMMLTPLNEDDVYKEKTVEGIFWLVSNCFAASGRQHVVNAIARHIRVDIAGKCSTDPALKTICAPDDTCEHVFKRYYFYVAMENSLCTDYITEKLWSRIHLPVIPIVLRREYYEK
ncbi:FUT-3 protein [Aphelenchoides avenae]|nr:FUT-3 protein [Aphelenchus avenae]